MTMRTTAFDAHYGALRTSVDDVDQQLVRWQQDHPEFRIESMQNHIINEPNSSGYVTPHYTLIVVYEEFTPMGGFGT